jgi:hypothetical protein
MRVQALVITLYVASFVTASPPTARAQDAQAIGPGGQQRTQPSAPATPTVAKTSAPATRSTDDALENPVLEQADEGDNITYMQSRVAFKYNHDEYNGGASGDRVRVDWLQSLGSSQRFAAGIEIPVVHFNGDDGEPSGNGLGDIKLQFRGMLGKGEKFENAVGFEITLPSASNDQVCENEAAIRVVWGFSAQVASQTLLSGELGYNKAVQSSHGPLGTNSIEPELILSQAFAKRAGGYLDWDTYYDFSASACAQTLKAGVEFELDHSEKWGLSPYFQFPLNHFTRITEFKNSVGVELSYNF